jgi:hypothetical protein
LGAAGGGEKTAVRKTAERKTAERRRRREVGGEKTAERDGGEKTAERDGGERRCGMAGRPAQLWPLAEASVWRPSSRLEADQQGRRRGATGEA